MLPEQFGSEDSGGPSLFLSIPVSFSGLARKVDTDLCGGFIQSGSRSQQNSLSDSSGGGKML